MQMYVKCLNDTFVFKGVLCVCVPQTLLAEWRIDLKSFKKQKIIFFKTWNNSSKFSQTNLFEIQDKTLDQKEKTSITMSANCCKSDGNINFDLLDHNMLNITYTEYCTSYITKSLSHFKVYLFTDEKRKKSTNIEYNEC